MTRTSGPFFLLVFPLVMATPGLAMQQPGGRGGPPVQGAEEDIPLVARFDRNGDKILDRDERMAARAVPRRASRAAYARRGDGASTTVGTPGRPVHGCRRARRYPASVPLYDAGRTQDVLHRIRAPGLGAGARGVLAHRRRSAGDAAVDGKTLPRHRRQLPRQQLVHGVPAGLKRPFSVTIDFVHEAGPARAHVAQPAERQPGSDVPARRVLYLDIARDYIPAPKANFVRVVVNGESWGVYVNQQTFSKEFVHGATTSTDEGHALEVAEQLRRRRPHLPRRRHRAVSPVVRDEGQGRSRRRGASWSSVDEGPEGDAVEQLEEALAPMHGRRRRAEIPRARRRPRQRRRLLEATAATSICILDPRGRFSLLPHDVNEGFRTGGRAGGGAQPDPLVALDDTNKALRHKLLAVPALRDRYLALRR